MKKLFNPQDIAEVFMFAFLSFLLPTLSGSFSSLPRYFVVIFPYFILLGGLLSSILKLLRVFVSGYWVA